MEVMLIALGELIVKMLLCLKMPDEKSLEASKTITDFAGKIGLKVLEKRKFERKMGQIVDSIIENCKPYFDRHGIGEERQQELMKTVVDMLSSISVDSRSMQKIRRNPDDLKNLLLTKFPDNIDYNRFDPKEEELLKALIDQLSRIIVRLFNEIPELSNERVKYLMDNLDNLTERAEVVIDELRKLETQLCERLPTSYKTFEIEYRNKIVDRYNYVHLFGVDELHDEMKKYKLSTSYVTLQVEAIKDYGGRDKRIVEFDQLLSKKRKNIWISGEAGSGKTTCLSWIATQIAEGKMDGELSKLIPVIIELRSLNLESLSIIDCINKARDSKNSSISIPEGWLEEKTKEHQMLFLIDGFDEIEEKERGKVFEWIERLDPRDRCYKVFTSRPQVNNRPKLDDLVEVKILPMGIDKIERFVEYWHVTVLKNSLRCSEEVVEEYRSNLIESIRNDNALRKLAQNPLLCAIISALHYKSSKNLPTSKRDLYEACCKMLLDGRENERKIKADHIELSYEQKKRIMSKLAYHMMINNKAETDIESAKRFLKSNLQDMALGHISDDKLIRYFINRTGMVFEPSEGILSFVHRSFQEYLCASEMARQEDLGLAMEKIANDNWMETICLLVGMWKKEYADRIIQRTIYDGMKKGFEKYLLYAFEYLSGAIEVSPDIRQSIEKEIKALIPPRQTKEAEALSKAGEIAVSHLVINQNYTEIEKSMCVRALSGIPSINSLKCSLYYLSPYQSEEITNSIGFDIGELMDSFTEETLKNEEIPLLLLRRIQKWGEAPFPLSRGMIRCLMYCPNTKIHDVIDSFPRKVNYEERSSCDALDVHGKHLLRLPTSLAETIEQLVIYEDDVNVSVFRTLTKLKTLVLTCTQEKLYSLNRVFNYSTIEQFVVRIESSDLFLNGSDLAFLKNCRKFVLIVSTYGAEISCDNFMIFDKLEELTIASEEVELYDYEGLEKCKSLKKLTLIGPYTPFKEENKDLFFDVEYIRRDIEDLLYCGTENLVDEFLEKNVPVTSNNV